MIIHAAGESARALVPRGTFAVALGSPGKDELYYLEKRLQSEHIPHVAFRESDEPFCGDLMAIGICPVEERRTVRRFLKKFKLLGENDAQRSVEEGQGVLAASSPRRESVSRVGNVTLLFDKPHAR